VDAAEAGVRAQTRCGLRKAFHALKRSDGETVLAKNRCWPCEHAERSACACARTDWSRRRERDWAVAGSVEQPFEAAHESGSTGGDSLPTDVRRSLRAGVRAGARHASSVPHEEWGEKHGERGRAVKHAQIWPGKHLERLRL